MMAKTWQQRVEEMRRQREQKRAQQEIRDRALKRLVDAELAREAAGATTTKPAVRVVQPEDTEPVEVTAAPEPTAKPKPDPLAIDAEEWLRLSEELDELEAAGKLTPEELADLVDGLPAEWFQHGESQATDEQGGEKSEG